MLFDRTVPLRSFELGPAPGAALNAKYLSNLETTTQYLVTSECLEALSFQT